METTLKCVNQRILEEVKELSKKLDAKKTLNDLVECLHLEIVPGKLKTVRLANKIFRLGSDGQNKHKFTCSELRDHLNDQIIKR